MSFTFQQAATATISAVTSQAITFANAPVNGELIAIEVVINSGTATITPPAGFAAKVIVQPTSRSVAIYWKIAGAGESTSYTFTFSASVSGGIVARRFSSSDGWDTDQSGGASTSASDSTGTASQISAAITTTANRLLVIAGYAASTSATNKQLNPTTPAWQDSTLIYSSRSRMAYRAAVGGSETLGYQLTDSTLDNRLAFVAAEFVELAPSMSSDTGAIAKTLMSPLFKTLLEAS